MVDRLAHSQALGTRATSPLLHNQSIGEAPPADAAPWERSAYYWDAMWEPMSTDREPVIQTLPIALGPFPARTPLPYVFGRSATGQVLCTDVVENKGHDDGSTWSRFDKVALIYWMQYQ